MSVKSIQIIHPANITAIVDDLHRSLDQFRLTEPAKFDEGRLLLQKVSQLNYELQHNRPLTPIADDGLADVAAFNSELARHGQLVWHKAPFLFVECFLYRKIASFFLASAHWKSYDYFRRRKIDGLMLSRNAVVELALQYYTIVSSLGIADDGTSLPSGPTYPGLADEAAELAIFTEMTDICLWGNATDLCLLRTVTESDLSDRQSAAARTASQSRILVDDRAAAFSVLRKLQQDRLAGLIPPARPVQVDIVLDNAGFELFSDLVLTGYLLASGLATKVVIRPKMIPWYVSDTMASDITYLISSLTRSSSDLVGDEDSPALGPTTAADPNQSGPIDEDAAHAALTFLSAHWQHLVATDKIVIRPHQYWTGPTSFWSLPSVAPDLYSELQESELVIFKGDLNYRKLTADGTWESATPFATALGPLGPGSNLRILALRTCKSDVIVGLSPGQDERLREEYNVREGELVSEAGLESRSWAWDGKFGVVQYSDGR